jgi:hypothetical protein
MTSMTMPQTWSSEVFTAAVGAAVWAPSIHNSQPWRFRRSAEGVDVLLDEARRPAVCDPDGRMARMSCGAAAYNLRLAFAVAGRPAQFRLGAGAVVAHLWPGPPHPPTPLERRLHRQIRRRHTNRGPFADCRIDPSVPAQLTDAARREGGWLTFIEGEPAITALAEAIHAADARLRADPAYMRELRGWSTGADDRVEGVGSGAAGAAPHPAELLKRRDFGGPGHDDTQDVTRDPVVAVFGVLGDDPLEMVRAGMALQGVLLTGADLGAAAAMYSQPVEVPATRGRLREMVGGFHEPQMVLRFGYAPTTCYTNRRPVADAILP